MNAIETKELRGINVKNLLSLIGATITICSIVLLTYSKLEAKIERFELQKQGDEKYTELRLRTLELNIKSIEIKVDEMKKDLDKRE